MSDDKAQKLLQGGIKAAKSGDKELARKAFLQVLKLEPQNEGAWLGLATVSDDSKEKQRILKKILEINPNNDKAKEALRRLVGDSAPATPAMTTTPEPPQIESLPPVVEDIPLPPIGIKPPARLQPNKPLEAPSMDDLELPPLPPIRPLGETPATPAPSSPSGGGKLKSLRSLRDQAPESEPESEAQPVEEATPSVPKIRTSEEAFALAPQPPSKGAAGTPIPDSKKIAQLAETIPAEIQQFLEEALADYLLPDTIWEQKKRGRAGESEYPVFLLQAGVAILVFLGIVGSGLTLFILNNPAAQKLLFAPTFTPTFTPTVTPTNTPGPTNTPSPTPQVSPSASPTLLPTVTPGNPDPNFPPDATRVYFPVGVQGSPDIDRAITLLNENRLDEAFEILQAERAATTTSGDFVSIYYLTTYYVLTDQPEVARELIASWDEEWEGTALIDRYRAINNVAKARLDLYDAQRIINTGGSANDLLTSAEELLTVVVSGNAPLDRFFMEAYILLSQRYLLADDLDNALLVVSNAISEVGYGSAELRMQRARVLTSLGRYAEALQELSTILKLDPFLETALAYQPEVALASDQPGLAVLFSQQYLLYYPGSVRGYLLLGLAREGENKDDLAINAYSRGLLGNEEDPAYLDILARRSNLYLRQGRFSLAQEDFSRALDLADNAPEIRFQRMQAAIISGDYETVLSDAEALLGSGVVRDANILLLQGRALIESGNDVELGITTINRAVAQGLPAADRPIAAEILARAQLQTEDFQDALASIDTALQSGRTGSRLYLRAQIQEALANNSGRTADLRTALLDYELLLTFGRVFNYPFLAEAQTRYDALVNRIGVR